MKLVDIIALLLIALLAVRAVVRARQQSRSGCGGGCSGCAQSNSCELPQKATHGGPGPQAG